MKVSLLPACSLLMVISFAIVDASVLDGYVAGSRVTGQPVFGALLVDREGNLYFCNDTDGDYYADAIYKLATGSSTPTLFAAGFGNVVSIVQDNAAAFYVGDNYRNADNEGDTVYRLVDLNQDGDCLDPGEVRFYLPNGATPDIADLAITTDGRMFLTDAAGAGTGNIYLAEDLNHDFDAMDDDELVVFGVNQGSGYMAGIAIHPVNQSTVYYCESGGNVYWLKDLDNDRDALDTGESGLFAGGLGGGYDLVFDAELDLFVSASDWLSGNDIIWECKPDRANPGVMTGEVQVFADISAAAGYITNMAFLNPAQPFEPFAANGATLYLSYLDPYYGNLSEVMTFTPQPRAVPALTPAGVLLLLAAVSCMLARKTVSRHIR